MSKTYTTDPRAPESKRLPARYKAAFLAAIHFGIHLADEIMQKFMIGRDEVLTWIYHDGVNDHRKQLIGAC